MTCTAGSDHWPDSKWFTYWQYNFICCQKSIWMLYSPKKTNCLWLCRTYKKISQFVDIFINPLVPKLRVTLGTPTHIINILNGITDPPNNAIMWTLDVNGLYTDIPHQEGIKAIQETVVIHRTPKKASYNSFIVEFLWVVLENNYSDFNGKHNHQIAWECYGHQAGAIFCQIIHVQFWGQACIYIPTTTTLVEKAHWWHISDLEPLNAELVGFHKLNNYHPIIIFTQEMSHSEVPFWTSWYISEVKNYSLGFMSKLQINTCTSDMTLNTQNISGTLYPTHNFLDWLEFTVNNTT